MEIILKKVLIGYLAISSLSAFALTAEQRQVRLLERVVGHKVDINKEFTTVIRGKIGGSAHDLYLGEDCSVEISLSPKDKSLSVAIDAYAGENNKRKTITMSLSKTAEEKMGESYFEQDEKPVVVQHVKLDFFNLHSFVNYGTGKPIKIMSSAISPVLGCVIDGNYQSIHKYIRL